MYLTRQQVAAVLLAEVLALMPLGFLATTVQAATTTTGSPVVCTQPDQDSTEVPTDDGARLDDRPEQTPPADEEPPEGAAALPTTRTFADFPVDEEVVADPGEGEQTPYFVVDQAALKESPFYSDAEFQKLTASNLGTYDAESGLWQFCSLRGMEHLTDPAPVSLGLSQYLEKLRFPEEKITFENPLDKFALTGEVCQRFDVTTGGCDETKESVPVNGLDGKPLLDTSGNPVTEQRPKYYDDSAWPNGQWDAPKAEARILKTLLYLVTPPDQGGAGREHITVGKIIQPSKKNQEFEASSTEAPESEVQDSAHSYDDRHPSKPAFLAQAVDITEIDKVRITTKITQRRRLGGNTTTYKYQSVPLKVAWQTDAGVATAPLVGPNMYQQALSEYTLDLSGILDSFDLEGTIDLSNVEFSSLGDIAELVGQSLLMSLLSSPGGSFKSWDFPSLLNLIGRSYLAQQLGLPGDALREGTTLPELLESIGRTTTEHQLNLPAGSLKGASASEVQANLGRRVLEQLLGISENALAPAGSATQTELLERIGAGRIEQRFGLEPGTARSNDWEKIRSIPKVKLLFNSTAGPFTDEALGLGFQPARDKGDTTQFGFTAQDFAQPTQELVRNGSEAAWQKYKRLVGDRTLASGIGTFSGTQTQYGSSNDTRPEEARVVSNLLTNLQLSLRTSTVLNTPPVIGADEEVVFQETGAGALYVVAATGGYAYRSGAISRTELGELARALVAGLRGSIYGESYAAGTVKVGYTNNNSPSTNPEAARSAYNRAQLTLRAPLQTALAKADSRLIDAEENRGDGVDIGVLREARARMSAGLSHVKTFQSGILTMFEGAGQSGRSAALGLPGTFWKLNADGTLTDEKLPSGDIDPVNAIMGGDLSQERLILLGRMFLAQQISKDSAARLTLTSQTLTDTASFGLIDTPGGLLGKLGIGSDSLTSKGISAADFDRIFVQGVGKEVFRRIGEEELLRTLWAKSDLQKTTGTGGELNGALRQVSQVAQGLSFYTSRFKEVQSIGKELATTVAQLGMPEVSELLTNLNQQEEPTSIDSSRQLGRKYEVVAKEVKGKDGSIPTKVERMKFLLREIASGGSLSFDTKPDSTKNIQNPVKQDGCWIAQDLRQAIQKGDLQMNTLVQGVAGCRLDDALSLPVGTSTTWLVSNDYTFVGLATAIGDAYTRQNRLTWGTETKQKYGEQYLSSTVVARLAGAAGGTLSTFLKRTTLNGGDIADLLTGGGETVLRKLGAGLIDGKLNWNAGTALRIVAPQCQVASGSALLRTCTGEEAADQRSRAMADLGLQTLGLSLDIPTSFSFYPSDSSLGNFSVAQNFGIAKISSQLALSSNSFYGTFSEVRGRNDAWTTLRALGWSETPLERFWGSLGAELRGTLSSGSASQAVGVAGLAVMAEQSLSDARNDILNEMSGSTAPIWSESPSISASTVTGVASRFQNMIEDIRIRVETSTSGALRDKLMDVVQRSEKRLIEDGNETTLQEKMNVSARATREHLKQLNESNGLDRGRFESFVQGNGRGEELGAQSTELSLATTLGNKLVREALKGTALEQLPDLFKNLSSGPCSDIGIMTYILNPDGACAKNISLNQLITGKDDATAAQRAFIFDFLLGNTFGMQLEESLSIESGTIAAIVREPWKARQIAIDQGIKLAARQLLQSDPSDTNRGDSDGQVVEALKASLVAGFCQVNPDSDQFEGVDKALLENRYHPEALCSYEFDSLRSVIAFRTSLEQMLRDRYQSDSTGSALSAVDIAALATGNTSTAYFIGAQTIAKQINSSLGSDPRAQKFTIRFDTIRDAFDQTVLTEDQLTWYSQQDQANFIRDYSDCYGTAPPPICAEKDNAKLIKAFVGSTAGIDGRLKLGTLSAIDARSRAGAPQLVQKLGQQSLQYQVYDAFAYKIEPDIPLGFSYAMLRGSDSWKTQLLGQYLINKLDLGAAFFGGLLTDDQVGALATYARNGFKGNIDGTAVTAFDTWITGSGKNLLGIELPTGTAASIFAWGQTGFRADTFDTSTTYQVGDQKVFAIGTTLKNWGITKLLGWSDKTLGFNAGGSFQIYKAAADVARASQFLAFAQGPLGAATDLGVSTLLKTLSGNPAPGTLVSTQNAARAQLRAAQVNLATTIATVVFADQISAAEQSLGLTPGTGSMAVTMLVQLAMGVPVDPITLALFIGLNLFGVYQTTIDVRATADGYYPFTGTYNQPNRERDEVISPDPEVGTFNAKKADTYRTGLRNAARYKVNAVLEDLLTMPSRWSQRTGDKPEMLWIPQIFTGRVEDVTGLDGLISQPAPWDSPGGIGYGSLEARNSITYDRAAGVYEAKAKAGYNAGVFAGAAFAGDLHLRW
jgi:hypothetical protein